MAEIAGLKLIVPSSVSSSGSASVSVSATGKVTFANVGTSDYAQINGCFSADYDNYLIVFAGYMSSNSGETNLFGQLCASDPPNHPPATTGYVLQYLYANNTTVSGRRDSPSTRSMHIGQASNEQRDGSHCYMYGPYLAQPTASRNVVVYGRNGVTIQDQACTHSASTSYDGLRLLCNSNTVDGSLTIYGFTKGTTP